MRQLRNHLNRRRINGLRRKMLQTLMIQLTELSLSATVETKVGVKLTPYPRLKE
jgi:hypothetical protein